MKKKTLNALFEHRKNYCMEEAKEGEEETLFGNFLIYFAY